MAGSGSSHRSEARRSALDAPGVGRNGFVVVRMRQDELGTFGLGGIRRINHQIATRPFHRCLEFVDRGEEIGKIGIRSAFRGLNSFLIQAREQLFVE